MFNHMNELSKLGECLIQANCDLPLRITIMRECTREGYCKHGYCTYRDGDITPGRRENRGKLIDSVSNIYAMNCAGGCIKSPTPDQIAKQLLRGREYRVAEVALPNRQYVVVLFS